MKIAISNPLPTAFQRPSNRVCSNPPYTPRGLHPLGRGASPVMAISRLQIQAGSRRAQS
jgi:hypothetical protein